MPDAGAITSRACCSERSDEIARDAMPAASVAHAEAHLGHPIQQGPRGAQLGRLQRRPGRAANALEGNAGKVGGFSLHAGVAAGNRQPLPWGCSWPVRYRVRTSMPPKDSPRMQKTPCLP